MVPVRQLAPRGGGPYAALRVGRRSRRRCWRRCRPTGGCRPAGRPRACAPAAAAWGRRWLAPACRPARTWPRGPRGPASATAGCRGRCSGGCGGCGCCCWRCRGCCCRWGCRGWRGGCAGGTPGGASPAAARRPGGLVGAGSRAARGGAGPGGDTASGRPGAPGASGGAAHAHRPGLLGRQAVLPAPAALAAAAAVCGLAGGLRLRATVWRGVCGPSGAPVGGCVSCALQCSNRDTLPQCRPLLSPLPPPPPLLLLLLLLPTPTLTSLVQYPAVACPPLLPGLPHAAVCVCVCWRRRQTPSSRC